MTYHVSAEQKDKLLRALHQLVQERKVKEAVHQILLDACMEVYQDEDLLGLEETDKLMARYTMRQRIGDDLKLCLTDTQNPKSPRIVINENEDVALLLISQIVAVCETTKDEIFSDEQERRTFYSQQLTGIGDEWIGGLYTGFINMVEVTRKTLVDVMSQGNTQLMNMYQNDKAFLFQDAEQNQLIPSAHILSNYNKARNIIFAHPFKYGYQDLKPIPGQVFQDKKGNIVIFDLQLFEVDAVINNFYDVCSSITQMTRQEIDRYCLQNQFPIVWNLDCAQADSVARTIELGIKEGLFNTGEVTSTDKKNRNQLWHGNLAEDTTAKLIKSRRTVEKNVNETLANRFLNTLLTAHIKE